MQYRLGQVYYMLGDYRRALDFFGRNVATLESHLRTQRVVQSGLPVVFPSIWWVWCCAELGEFAAGIAHGEEAIRTAEAADHPQPHRGLPRDRPPLPAQGGHAQAIFMLERGLELARVWNVLTRLHQMAADLGAAYALSGRVTEALALLEQTVQRGTAIRAVYQALWVTGLGESYRLAGHLEEAMPGPDVPSSIAVHTESEDIKHGPLRLLAAIAAQRESPEVEQAEDYFRQALTLAEELGMRPLVAHCHRPWHAVSQDRPVGAGSCRAVCGYGTLPCHGHDPLATPGRDGVGAGGSALRCGEIAGRRHGAQPSWISSGPGASSTPCPWTLNNATGKLLEASDRRRVGRDGRFPGGLRLCPGRPYGEFGAHDASPDSSARGARPGEPIWHSLAVAVRYAVHSPMLLGLLCM